MKFPVDLKAVIVGTLVYLVGYGACLVPSHLIEFEQDSATAKLLTVLVMLVPLASGAIAAKLASSRLRAHGTIVGALGTAISLAVIVVGAHVDVSLLVATAALLGASLLGMLGATLVRRSRVGL
jgi:hypothetical protein